MLLETLNTDGVWSIARGLARNEGVYKSLLVACDSERRNDLDGRGHLSQEALTRFTRFFLTTCLDQVEFMEELVQPDRLRDRILICTEEEIRADILPPRSGAVLEAVLYRGELPRGDVANITGTSERQARRINPPRSNPKRLPLKARARPSISPPPPNWPHAGCRGLSGIGPEGIENLQPQGCGLQRGNQETGGSTPSSFLCRLKKRAEEQGLGRSKARLRDRDCGHDAVMDNDLLRPKFQSPAEATTRTEQTAKMSKSGVGHRSSRFAKIPGLSTAS